MRAFLVVVGLFLLGISVTSAEAHTVWITGAAADHFIARYLPNASIPGPINQAFSYVSHHHRRHGWASCIVPAMGGRSDGEVSTCYVKF